MGQTLDPFPGQRGVAYADTINAMRNERFGHGLKLFLAIVRRDLDHQGDLSPVLFVQTVLGLSQGGQQGIQCIAMLKLP